MKVVTIGRSEENDVVLDDVHASRHHLQIILHDDGHYTMVDFGSTNGTYVNGQKISGEIDLSHSDIVRIGNSTIPWRIYFESDDDIKSDLIDDHSHVDLEECEYAAVAPETKDNDNVYSTGLIITVFISVIMIFVGLSGLLSRGMGRSVAMAIAGAVLLLIVIIKIIYDSTKQVKN